MKVQLHDREVDTWQSRFGPAAEHDAGGGIAMYRRCLLCGGHALEGSLSAHARFCAVDAVDEDEGLYAGPWKFPTSEVTTT